MGKWLSKSINMNTSQLEHKDRMNKFDEVRSMLNDIPNINAGGCGIAALAMARWIKKNAKSSQLKTVYVMGHHDIITYTANSNHLINKHNTPMACYHIGLILYDLVNRTQCTIDSGNTFHMWSYPYLNTFTEDSVLITAINQVHTWNTDFNRRKFVPIISEMLGISLDDVDCRTNEEYLDNAEIPEKQPTIWAVVKDKTKTKAKKISKIIVS